MKPTLVLGASPNPYRYSCIAAKKLISKGYKVYLLGNKNARIAGKKIQTKKTFPSDIHTVTVYLNPSKQEEYKHYLADLNPNRVIFNPGTENPEMEKLLKQKGIEIVKDCTLILLDNGKY